MAKLEFFGRITSGVGLYSEMTIPGRPDLDSAPADWPDELCRGSLNVVIDQFPEGFAPPVGRSRGTYQLDDRAVPPAFMIPGKLILENKLVYNGGPSPAQVWRAVLRVTDRRLDIPCWVVRRLGSNVGKNKAGNVLEIVSDTHLRSRYGLQDHEQVILELQEG